MKKRFGFTLAEVLITLSIIGLIAALTTPNLLNNTNEKELITQFQKTYSTLQQAYIMASQENGTADTWADAQTTYNYLKPYLNIIENCPKTYGCFPNIGYKTIKGTPYTSNNYYGSNYYKARLEDGTSLLFVPPWESLVVLYVDTNGDKAPNQWGEDLFAFLLTTKAEAPSITGYSSWWAGTNFCSKTKDATGWIDGGSCSTWIIKHGNMDYLHRDISASEWNQ